MNKILAIDPGPVESAILIWDGEMIHEATIGKNEDVRRWLVAEASYIPMAIEMIACYGMPVGAETFETCLFIGRLQEIWESRERVVRLVYRKDIKLHLCGTTKAKDANIRQALIDKHGNVGTKKNPGPLYGVKSHLWSALAVADYALEKHFNNL